MEIGNPEFKPSVLPTLFDKVCVVKHPENDWTNESWFEKLTELTEQLRITCLEETSSWLEAEIGKLQEETAVFRKTWESLVEQLETEIRVELGRKPFTLLLHAVSNAGDKYKGIFEYFPYIARLDFQEAYCCLACNQYTAAVVMAWRGAEKIAREYRYRLTGNNSSARWKDLISELSSMEQLRPDLKERMEEARKSRNEFAHPERRLGDEEGSEAQTQIDKAFTFACELTRDLLGKGKALHVGVCELTHNAVPTHCHPDILLALLILEENFGIGRLTYVSEGEYDADDFNDLIGIGQGKHGLESTTRNNKSISRLIADKFPPRQARYRQLVRFVEQIRYREQPKVNDNPQSKTVLELLLEAALDLYQGNQVHYREWVTALFKRILDAEADPNSSDLPWDLSLPSGFNPLLNRAKRMQDERQRLAQKENDAWEARRESNYAGVHAVLLELADTQPSVQNGVYIPSQEALRTRAFEEGYRVVLYTNAKDTLEIRHTRGVNIDYGPLYRHLRSLYGRPSVAEPGGVGFTVSGVAITAEMMEEILREVNAQLAQATRPSEILIDSLTTLGDSIHG